MYRFCFPSDGWRDVSTLCTWAGHTTPPFFYVENDKFEYIFAPNQHIERFGNEIFVNEYSMRSLSLRQD